MTAAAVAVHERPILFSGPMVRAILDGRKTQTRRVVKRRLYDLENRDDDSQSGWCQSWPDRGWTPDLIARDYPCPYGQPGDRLWVRESFSRCGCNACRTSWPEKPAPDPTGSVHYPAYRATHAGSELAWRPSIHMPRWASRLTLEITDVRVERLQAISETDAKAEGAERGAWPDDCTADDSLMNAECGYFPPRSYAAGFAALWDSINSARGFGWDANPWVWVLAFRRVS